MTDQNAPPPAAAIPPGAAAATAMPQIEISRLGPLLSFRSVAFTALCGAGLILGVLHVFSISLGGVPMLEGQYFWLFIGIFTAAGFLAIPAHMNITHVPIYDVAAALAAVGIGYYFSAHAWEMAQGGWSHTVLGTVIWILMLEMARRAGGLPFLLVVLLLGLYPLVADRFPGLLMGIPYQFDHMIEAHVFRTEGMMGITTSIVAEVVLGFLVFAGVLIATGAGQFFIDLANAGFGRYRGGPAKVSVVASGFFGSLSGSVFSNIAGTGSLTIPAMKRAGYPPHYAGAIESCASMGGVVMPPVMGAIAFVMAITIGVDYVTVMLAAILPSLLFYFGLLLQVDAYAARKGIKGDAQMRGPGARRLLATGWPFLVVMAFLVWGLLYMRWEYYAPWYACLLLLALACLRRETRPTPIRLLSMLRQTGLLITQTSVIILPIAFVVSGLTITGVTGSMTSGLIALGGQNIILIIGLGILACFVMGMAGLSIVAYIFLAVTLAPAMIEIGGLNTVAVHFFIVYFSMISAITPPVGAAAFLAATIARAQPMRTCFTAMRLGCVIYFVPIFFLFQPALLLQGDLTPLIYVLPSIIIGIMLLSGGLEGYLLGVGPVRPVLRLPLIAAGFAFSIPGPMTTVLGGLASALVGLLVWIDNRDRTPELAARRPE